MKIGAIIQARMESKRFPGKVMADLCGKPILQHVVERAREAVENVYIVTPPESREIIEFAKTYSIPYCLDRKSRDVLDSFYNCAQTHKLDSIVRLTADNPLVSPVLIKKLVEHHKTYSGLDWAGNSHLKTTYPIGLDIEVISFKALEKAWLKATSPYDREHVTPYIYNHPDKFKLKVFELEIDLSFIRLTVDYPEDLEYLNNMLRRTH